MSRKSRGICGERDLVHKFWEYDWPAVRVAGSGSSRYPSPDVLVGNRVRRLAIECKTCKANSKYIEKRDIRALKDFSSRFGAEPWIAIKFKRQDWLFIPLEDLTETEKSFVITLDIVKRKGLLLEELIQRIEE